MTAPARLQSKGIRMSLMEPHTRISLKVLPRGGEEEERINLSRRAHIGARAELNEVASALTELVDILDGFNRFRFQANPEQLAVWNAARSVVAHRPRKSPAPPAESPGPAPTGGSTQAA